MKFSMTLAICLFAFAPAVLADPPSATPLAANPPSEPASVTATTGAAAEPRLSINPNLAGIIVGNYGGNVEYLFPGGHGLLVEGAYWSQSGSQSSLSGGSATVGYRWHWRGRQNSGFLGINASASIANGNASVTDSSGNAMTYGASIRQLSVTGNIGKRWMIGPANITFRIGAGYASRNVSVTSSTDPTGAAQASKDLNNLIALLPIALDGELSVGYAF